jgi:hypothetical protein
MRFDLNFQRDDQVLAGEGIAKARIVRNINIDLVQSRLLAQRSLLHSSYGCSFLECVRFENAGLRIL